MHTDRAFHAVPSPENALKYSLPGASLYIQQPERARRAKSQEPPSPLLRRDTYAVRVIVRGGCRALISNILGKLGAWRIPCTR